MILLLADGNGANVLPIATPTFMETPVATYTATPTISISNKPTPEPKGWIGTVGNAIVFILVIAIIVAIVKAWLSRTRTKLRR